jgi:hypothetical protein
MAPMNRRGHVAAALVCGLAAKIAGTYGEVCRPFSCAGRAEPPLLFKRADRFYFNDPPVSSGESPACGIPLS